MSADAAVRELFALAATATPSPALARFISEAAFALRLCEAHPRSRRDWEALLSRAAVSVSEAATTGCDLDAAVRAAEEVLAPLGTVAKSYTIHCVGHAHIDMDWMWNWPETVATTNDTFTTVDRLLEEFPEFHFSQSQASVYQIARDYLPELYARIKQRIAEGRWEVTAAEWVESDKNLPSGEALCRHLLSTRRFLQRELGLSPEAVTIAWNPDAFGHAATLPTILSKAGVRRYYFCRSGPGPQLFWWQGPDGSRVLAFDDRSLWYLGPLGEDMTKHLFEFERATGLRDILYVYGVGDHGGGPTRRDLRAARDMNAWPIYPNVTLGTTDAFFAIAEQHARELPVYQGEMNFVFEGCYSSQSGMKRANRKCEHALIEAEGAALLGRGLAGLAYPSEELHLAWQHALFNQFHDILPGSGVHATYEYAQGLYQEILARTTMIKTRALRGIAARVDTAVACSPGLPEGEIGGGQGDLAADGSVSRRGAGQAGCDPFVVFNPCPWERSEVVQVRVWDRTYEGPLAVCDDRGILRPAQVLGSGDYWQHRYTELAFPAPDLPGLGYRSFSVLASDAPAASACAGNGQGMIENDFYRVEVEAASGAIIHLVDKLSGIDFVPPRKRLGVLECVLEAPHGMSAWVIGEARKTAPLIRGAAVDCPQSGPWLASVRSTRKSRDSTLTLTVSLLAGVPRVDLTFEIDWLERGSPEIGVPALRALFPVGVQAGAARFECPNGYVERPTDRAQLTSHTHLYSPDGGRAAGVIDVPAQRWVDLTGRRRGVSESVGLTVLSDSLYGYRVEGSTLRATLLRSSYEPDPLPELGSHTFRLALVPHVGDWPAWRATRAAHEFNLRGEAVATTVQTGDLPAQAGFAEILTPNVMLSALKRAEDSDAAIVRLYETEGRQVRARVALAPVFAAPDAAASETDLLERVLPTNSAAMENGVLGVDLPPFGLVTVRVG